MSGSTSSDEQSATPASAAALDYVTNIKYNAAGQKTRITYGNGVVTEYHYNPLNFRLKRIKIWGRTT